MRVGPGAELRASTRPTAGLQLGAPLASDERGRHVTILGAWSHRGAQRLGGRGATRDLTVRRCRAAPLGSAGRLAGRTKDRAARADPHRDTAGPGPLLVRDQPAVAEAGLLRPGVRRNRLARRHPQRAVEPDRLAVQHRVLDDLAGELAVLLGPAEPRREGDARAERLALLLGQRGEQRGVEESRGDRASPGRRGPPCRARPAASGRRRRPSRPSRRPGRSGRPRRRSRRC